MKTIGQIAKRLLLAKTSPFRGIYGSREEVAKFAQSSPWDEALRRVGAATEAVRSGAASYQRDSVVFDDNMLPVSLLYVLANSAYLTDGELSVVDFGGGLGGTYFHCSKLLPRLQSLAWTVIEQEEFVKVGKRQFETAELTFHSSLADLNRTRVDVLIFSSVLGYLENPYEIVERGLALKPGIVFIDRLPTSPGCQEDFWTLQVVADSIYPSRVPMRVFGDSSIPDFLTARQYRYFGKTVAVDPSAYASSKRIEFAGHVFLSAELMLRSWGLAS